MALTNENAAANQTLRRKIAKLIGDVEALSMGLTDVDKARVLAATAALRERVRGDQTRK